MTVQKAAAAARLAAMIARDLAGLAGVVLIIIGIARIYAPAGFIAAGLCALAPAVLHARRPSPVKPD